MGIMEKNTNAIGIGYFVLYVLRNICLQHNMLEKREQQPPPQTPGTDVPVVINSVYDSALPLLEKLDFLNLKRRIEAIYNKFVLGH